MQLPRILISLEVDGSREVNKSPETFPANGAQARFAGCIFMRHIILAFNTVLPFVFGRYMELEEEWRAVLLQYDFCPTQR
jgi:hypothetical protein